MKTIIHEIRQQPHHVREIATIVCTVAVAAVVVFVWFHSFQKNIYTLLNPEDQTQSQDKVFAQESKSLFGSILQTLSDGKAQIASIFSGTSSQSEIINIQNQETVTGSDKAYPFPVSGNR
ncbi:MAG: hypothetical protein KBC81_02280 [Candidatus Pacebacteria bacterium]|nr:hypothetical protein [Candidatus Paceibacterota bacterium]